jgi:hypothetical protein
MFRMAFAPDVTVGQVGSTTSHGIIVKANYDYDADDQVDDKAEKFFKLGAATGNQIMTGTDDVLEWGIDHPALVVYLSLLYMAGIVGAFFFLVLLGYYYQEVNVFSTSLL